MKNFIFSIFFLCATLIAYSQKRFTVTGNLTAGCGIDKVVFQYNNDTGKLFLDTVAVINNSFKYSKKIERPVVATLLLLNSSKARKGSEEGEDQVNDYGLTMFYLEGNLQTKMLDKEIKITGGGEEQLIWQKYIADSKSKKVEDDTTNKMLSGFELFQSNIATFVKQHPDSYVSLDLVEMGFTSVISPQIFEPVYNSLSPRMKNTSKARAWLKKLEVAKKIDEGKPAPLFTQNDINDKPVSLQFFHGKYILIDFWASWCAPCRATNPELIKIYEKFKDKNFTILGISLDDNKESWLKAIKADGLVWTQVSDLKGWRNAVGKLYAVESIPQNFLVGPDGIIAGKNLTGAALENKLSELLKQMK